MKGLEPSRLAAHAPKACVSTNSTTSAQDELTYEIIADVGQKITVKMAENILM